MAQKARQRVGVLLRELDCCRPARRSGTTGHADAEELIASGSIVPARPRVGLRVLFDGAGLLPEPRLPF